MAVKYCFQHIIHTIPGALNRSSTSSAPEDTTYYTTGLPEKPGIHADPLFSNNKTDLCYPARPKMNLGLAHYRWNRTNTKYVGCSSCKEEVKDHKPRRFKLFSMKCCSCLGILWYHIKIWPKPASWFKWQDNESKYQYQTLSGRSYLLQRDWVHSQVCSNSLESCSSRHQSHSTRTKVLNPCGTHSLALGD